MQLFKLKILGGLVTLWDTGFANWVDLNETKEMDNFCSFY